jgi:hypothetical protein
MGKGKKGSRRKRKGKEGRKEYFSDFIDCTRVIHLTFCLSVVCNLNNFIHKSGMI